MATKDTTANDLNKVCGCYVAGICLTKAVETFRTIVSFGNGGPVIGREPDLSEGRTKYERVYRVLGTKPLGGGSATVRKN